VSLVGSEDIEIKSSRMFVRVGDDGTNNGHVVIRIGSVAAV
jgi:hypothetical protein